MTITNANAPGKTEGEANDQVGTGSVQMLPDCQDPAPTSESTRRFLAGIARLLAKELPDLDWCWTHHRYDEECGCNTREQVAE